VEFVKDVTISTQSHNLDSGNFESIYAPVIIEDNCWISLNTTILKGVILAEYTVLAAGAVVTKSTEKNGVYAGVPAKKIKERIVNE
jgi:maltose O-acetyltransferase